MGCKETLALIVTFVLVTVFTMVVYAGEIDDLIEQLENGTESQRQRASEDLMYNPGSNAIPLLVQAFDSPNSTFRADIAYTLAGIGEWYWTQLSRRNLEMAIEKLESALSDSYWRVRANAAFALGSIGAAAREIDLQLVLVV